MANKRVTWTPDEVSALAAETVRIRIKDPRDALLKIVALAQETALPEESRRSIPSINQAGKAFLTRFDELYRHEIGRHAEDFVPPIQPVAVPEKYGLEQALDEATPDQLLTALARRFTAHMVRQLAPTISEAVADLITSPTRERPSVPRGMFEPEVDTKVSSKRILVIGLLPNQESAVKEATKSLNVTLRFVEATRRPEINGIVDYIVVARHTSHSWFETAQKAVGASRVAFSNGGVSTVIAKIYDINSRQ